jgi:surfeit locus 1 family protein
VSGRASLLFTLSMTAVLLGCLGLGTWQLQRLQWKQALLDRIAVQMAAPAATLPETPEDWRPLDFRRFTISGHYLHEHEQILGPRSYRGQSGYHVITPFRLTDTRLLLVNRGWVPPGARDPGRRAEGQLRGSQTVTGVLRAEFARGTWTPDYDAGARLWFWYDVAGIAGVTGLALLAPVLQLDAGTVAGGLPIGGITDIAIPNNHLQYAITWLALALVTLVMFVIFRLRTNKEDRP